MSKYDLFFTLVTVVYGLMLTNLFSGIHRVIRMKKAIKWHWLPILVVWYLFLVIIKNWWDLALPGGSPPEINVYIFLCYCHLLVLIYLLSSAVWPDSITAQGLILKEYYLGNAKYFWGLMIAVNIASSGISFLRGAALHIPFSIMDSLANSIGVLLMLPLFFSRKLWLHEILVVIFTLIVCFEIFISR